MKVKKKLELILIENNYFLKSNNYEKETQCDDYKTTPHCELQFHVLSYIISFYSKYKIYKTNLIINLNI